jgi:hypothetical protein
MNAHPARIGGKARHGVLVVQSLMFLIAAPDRLLSQTAVPEPIASQVVAPPDQMPALLPGGVAEPVASDQKAIALTHPVSPSAMPSKPVDEVKRYLWDVYQRSSAKTDSHGDFTWKDVAAADIWGLSMEDYVIGGMDRDFRELLFAVGRAMDADGISWSILSGFRDDFRQNLAVGLRARCGNSFHGGSVATGGYGHGCAADLASSDGLSDDRVWSWLDRHGQRFGLRRPLPSADPAHVQPILGWRQVAAALRDERRASEVGSNKGEVDVTERELAGSGSANSPFLSEEQLACSHSRHLAGSSEVHKNVHRTQAPKVAFSKEHRNHSVDKAAHEHSRSASSGPSSQAKGHGIRSRRVEMRFLLNLG